ncbi:MAG: molecular chaperone HtpG, partial [Gammaproteobacteria bacterium]|nr:molecular chaperone HtpG [Gammaproteobacteria bacterium]
ENLGTIAHSGTANFVKKLTGDAQKDSQLIGQFGVGFYSSFMLADRVTVISRRAGVSEKEAVRWESKGDGEYTVENVEKATRGTDVILHLKEDADEYLDYYKVRATLLKYSDHIALPILMKEPALSKKEGDESQAEKTPEYKVVNKATALWTRARADITDAEYKEFYKSLSYDYEEPWTWIHNQVEGNQQYTTLLYIPKRPPFDLWDRERKSGLKLYIKRVFIMDNAEVLPGYLRFVKGVLDSNDLPLNVSREILQNNRLLESIRAASIKKILGHLEKMAETAPEEYSAFWKAFGNVLKEGPAEDFIHREKIAELLRFATTFRDEETQNVSLADYVSRMKPDQKHIYYLTAENFLAAKNSPHLELFRKKGVEVLLLSDRV